MSNSERPTITISSRTPSIHKLRVMFLGIFGHPTTQADRDHRAATSMTPRVVVGRDDRLNMPLTHNLGNLIQRSHELARWAEDPPSGEHKLLLVKPIPPLMLNSVRPSEWYTAEILNQSLPSRLHGRETVVLHFWCRRRRLRSLLPTLIMQLVLSEAFSECRSLRLRDDPSTGLPREYSIYKLVDRDVEYMLKTLHWLVRLLGDRVTVFCVFDAFDGVEDRAAQFQLDEILHGLLSMTKLSCLSRGEPTDFRLLLMGPRFTDEGHRPKFAQYFILKRIVERHGVVLFGGSRREVSAGAPAPRLGWWPQNANPAWEAIRRIWDEATAEEQGGRPPSRSFSDDSWHTAEERDSGGDTEASSTSTERPWYAAGENFGVDV